MIRVWLLAVGLLVSCHHEQNVRREVWPPTKGAEPVPKVAETTVTPAAPARVLDPNIVALPHKSAVEQARSALERGNPAKAREIAEAAVARATGLDKGRLHWLAAQSAYREGYNQVASAHFETLGGLRHPLAPWAELRRAQLLERQDPATATRIASTLTNDWAGQERARGIERRITGTHSGSPVAVRSQSQPAKNPKVHPRTKQNLEKAEALYEAKRYNEAQRLLARMVRNLGPGTVVWCEARYKQGHALLQDRERTRGAPIMKEVADRCVGLDADTRAWARYHAGRAYGRVGRWDDSIAQFEKLEREAPGHRLADDSSYRAALAELEIGRTNAALARLALVHTRYPEGDMWPRAMFRLGWLQFRDGNYDNAFRQFDTLMKKGGDTYQEGITGRADYWRARSLFAMGRRIDAVEAYTAIAERWPLRYYAQQALGRLFEIVPDRAQAIVDVMRANEPSRMVFAWRPEFDDPAFSRMLELLMVGEISYATEEMEALEMVGGQVEPEMAVVGAVLLQHAGAETTLSRVIRDHFEDFEGLLPKGEGRLIWEATYPQAFSPLIEKIAEDQGVPAAFVRAVAREESSFEPDAVSWAKAYGLVQLIMPTARRFAPEVGVKATPRTLKRPEVNLKIGAAYMAWLWDRFQQNPALVPAAYNAGEGAVSRWLDEDSSRGLDVFIEEIPYDETRRYTRRVLQTYGVYQWLANEQLPPLRAALPRDETMRYSAAGF